MDTTMIIGEDVSETAESVKLIERVLGPSKCADSEEFNGDFGNSKSAAVVFTPTKNHLFTTATYAHELLERRVALICISENESLAWECLDLEEKQLGTCIRYCMVIPPLSTPSTGALSAKIAVGLKELRRNLKDCMDMPEKELMLQIEQVFSSHDTCTLCTGFDGNLRATPIEYTYSGGKIYFISEGGEKYASLAANPRVSVALYNSYSGFDKLEGLQVEGAAEMVESYSAEYLKIMEKKGLSEVQLRKMPVSLSMFCVEPQRIEILKSSFAKHGYSAKQTWTRKELHCNA